MNILHNRIESFQNNVVKWPYTNNSKYAKTESFAKAGFYFIRRPKAPDSVRCFLCDIELSHWRPNQSPFVRHSAESPHCAWKRLNFPDAHKKPLSDPSKANDRPRSTIMRSARLSTFNCHNYWPPKKGTAKYPTATKLAGAGFFFTPTANLPSRVKCAYCGESVIVYPNDTDFLNKHQEISSDCPFFEETHTTRNSRIRENSTKSRESSVKGDESDADSASSKRRVSKISSSSETTEPTSKRPKEQHKVLKSVVITKKRTTSESKKKETVQKATTTDDSIWDFNQILTPPKPSRRVMVTYGSSKSVHHVPLSSRNNPSSVNILPDLRSSLIIKPDGPFIASPASKPMEKTQKTPQVRTQPKVTPTRRVENAESSTSSTFNKKETLISRKRTLSTSSDNDTPPSKKANLKKTVGTKITNTETTSIPKRTYKDKGKGREVEHNLSQTLSPKKTISLSRSRNKLPVPSLNERTYIPAAEGSGTSYQAPIYTRLSQDASSSNTNYNTRDALPSNIASDNQDVLSSNTNYNTRDVLPSNIANDTQNLSSSNPAHDTQDVSPSNPARKTQYWFSYAAHDTKDVSPSNAARDTQDVSPSNATRNTQYVSSSDAAHDTQDVSPSNAARDTQYVPSYDANSNTQAVSSYKTGRDTQEVSPHITDDTQEVPSYKTGRDTQEFSPHITDDTQDVSPRITDDTRDVSPRVTQDNAYLSPRIAQDTVDVSNSPIAQITADAFELSIFHDSADEFDFPIAQNSEDEATCMLNPPSPVYTHDKPLEDDKENVPPPIRFSPIREHPSEPNSENFSPVYVPDSPIYTQNDSPVYIPDSPTYRHNNSNEPSPSLARTPSTPHRPMVSAITNMSFLQSTPSDTQRRLASAIDIFGDCPLSPIRPPQVNQFEDLRYTPALMGGRVGSVIGQDEEGQACIVRTEGEPLQAGLLSEFLDQNQSMTVEEHWQSLVDAGIERLQEKCEADIKKIEEKFRLTRDQLEKY